MDGKQFVFHDFNVMLPSLQLGLRYVQDSNSEQLLS